MRKPSGNAKIYSNDAQGHSIEVTVKFVSLNGLEKSEVKQITLTAARRVADLIRELPYTNFGPENTKVSV